jgi:hypothetical protein
MIQASALEEEKHQPSLMLPRGASPKFVGSIWPYCADDSVIAFDFPREYVKREKPM